MGKKKKHENLVENRNVVSTRVKWKRPTVYIKKNWVFITGVVLCILMIFFHAKSAGHYANFYPINGTFQNYNPVRRLISGQIPYRDFQDYLGLGHLYLGSVFTLLFGGTYRASLIAFSFLTLGGFAAISFIVAKVMFRKKEWAIALTNILIVIIILQPFFYTNGLAVNDDIRAALNYALGVGNSARFVRGLIVPISIAFILMAKRLIEKKFATKMRIASPVLTGVVAGFSFVWSNDFGISCWLCIFLMSFWYKLTEDRKLSDSLKTAGIELGSSLVSVFIFVEIFTVGHFGEWLQSTFGTGAYQRWYYNSEKTYYVWDADFSYLVIIQAGLCIYYLIRMLSLRSKDGDERKKFTGLAYVNMVGVCAVQEYRILSGGNSREVAFSILFMTVLYEIISLIIRVIGKMNNHYVVTVVSMISGMALVFSFAHDEFVFDFLTEKEGVYISEMGGNVTNLGDDLLNTAQFLGEDKFFSTYASAQEVVSNQFQPSGTDYIIHVLGDEQRTEYLNAYNNGDFRYVTTIKDSYTDWEYWVQRANWFLYRELYKDWHPVFANTYEVYWERNEANEKHALENEFDLQVIQVDDSTVKISIQSSSQGNGIADVFIDYEVKSRGNLTSYLNLQKMLKVENTGIVYARQGSFYESNYLRDKSAEYIPVPITNGYGEVTLTSNPKKSSYLELYSCKLNTVYTVTSDYLEISEVRDGNTLCVVTSEKAKNAVPNISEVIYGGSQYSVEEIAQDGNGIYIRVAGNIEISKSNMVELVR